MDTSKIADVLIFKGGYYYLTYLSGSRLDGEEKAYTTIESENFSLFGIDRNGFEFPGDAYAYLLSLSPLREPRKNGVHLDMTDEVYDKEEERLKEMGEV